MCFYDHLLTLCLELCARPSRRHRRSDERVPAIFVAAFGALGRVEAVICALLGTHADAIAGR